MIGVLGVFCVVAVRHRFQDGGRQGVSGLEHDASCQRGRLLQRCCCCCCCCCCCFLLHNSHTNIIPALCSHADADMAMHTLHIMGQGQQVPDVKSGWN